jgi:hypothetical protein
MPTDNDRPMLRPARGARCAAFVVALAVVLLGSCRNEGPSGSGEVLVRVRNDRGAAIAVSIGPANFGSVAPAAITGYKAVNEQGNLVIANGVVIDTADFCEGCTGFGDNRWTYSFYDGGFGFGMDLSVRGGALPQAPSLPR